MTMPNQRTRAVMGTREFLLRLMSPYLSGGLKRIPKHVREEAQRLLRHYPGVVDIAAAGHAVPTVFDEDEAWRCADPIYQEAVK